MLTSAIATKQEIKPGYPPWQHSLCKWSTLEVWDSLSTMHCPDSCRSIHQSDQSDEANKKHWRNKLALASLRAFQREAWQSLLTSPFWETHAFAAAAADI
jgi:hypothetical protein